MSSNPNNAAVLAVGPDDVEAALATWFAPIRRSSVAWETGDGLPFTQIIHISGSEDIEIGYADPIVQLDTLADKKLGWVNARNEAATTHQRMLYLGFYQPQITLSGRTFGVDYVKVIESPHWIPFGDPNILRKVGRYQVGLQYVPVSYP